MAEQREPVRRRVAVRIIKLGMNTKEVIARFGDTHTCFRLPAGCLNCRVFPRFFLRIHAGGDAKSDEQMSKSLR
jgi:hypothetical protein